MIITIDGIQYQMTIKRGKRLLNLFFKTKNGLYDNLPFTFTHSESKNVLQRLIWWKEFKHHLVHGCTLRCERNCTCTISKVQLIPYLRRTTI